MDWFERLTGFIESDYATTRTRLEVVGTELRSKINGGAFGIGELELVALQTLRERATSRGGPVGRLIFRNIRGDARALHRSSEFSGAMFQVASQFNLLEMVSPDVVPEKGVTRYQYDKTQGPACAIAAGAGTIFRNYFVPIDGEQGQTSQRQLDGLRDLGSELAGALGRQLGSLWKMSNGYALCTSDGLDAIAGYLRTASSEELDRLRGLL